LKGLFWAGSQSRRDYEAFGDVVVFDSTYSTNKYNLPFVPFVGLNHHRNTVFLDVVLFLTKHARHMSGCSEPFLKQ
jgi:hypothetical protein